MTKSEKQWWEQKRAQGRDAFILRVGLLRHGLPFGVFVTMATLLIDFFRNAPMDPLSKMIVKLGFLTLAFGYLPGIRIWKENEKDFKKPTADDEDAA